MFEFLTKNMANLYPYERSFHQAIESGTVSDLQIIITQITNSRDEQGRTPLCKAVAQGDTDMAR